MLSLRRKNDILYIYGLKKLLSFSAQKIIPFKFMKLKFR